MHDVFDFLRAAAVSSGAPAHETERYLDSFRTERPAQRERTRFETHSPPDVVLRAARHVLSERGFDVSTGVDPERRSITGRIERDLTDLPWIAAYTRMRGDWRCSFQVTVEVSRTGQIELTTTRRLPAWTTDFRTRLTQRLAATDADAMARSRLLAINAVTPTPTVLAPGQLLSRPFHGTLRDYSGCATREQVADLTAASGGCLPLGRHSFVGGDGTTDHGPELFLTPLRHDKALREHRGTLICAPQGAGKTELLARWAQAANAAGYNLFIVDVKGNLLQRLIRGGRWKGKVCHFTTDPRRTPGDTVSPPCQAVNFLERLNPWSRVGIHQIRQLAEALLPADSADDGEMKVCRANWTNWLATLIHLVLVDEFHAPYTHRRVDLADVYELASDEQTLIACVQRIAEAEEAALAKGEDLPSPSLQDLFNEIAVLLPPIDIAWMRARRAPLVPCRRKGFGPSQVPPISPQQPQDPTVSGTPPASSGLPDSGRSGLDVPLRASDIPTGPPPGYEALIGQRAEHTYRWLTENLVGALRPFQTHGLLGDKISGAHDVSHFSVESVAGLNDHLEPAHEQVTVVITAREQEGDAARTILSLTMARLQHALFERTRHTGNRAMRPALLLLDETRRIRNFKANEYISFAREAEAGCVVVYQSLEQAGDERQVAELLENVGTQIYLGSLVRSTARHFIESLPKRHRATFALTNAGADGFGSIQVGQETIDYFSTADLYVLPAGKFPALVQLNDQPRRAPILVTLDHSPTAASAATSPPPAAVTQRHSTAAR